MQQKAFCVFEGGGAKGVAHVGALRAIESYEDLTVRGYAGTSAGAIVAALAACGWTSDDILRDAGGRVSSPALEAIGRTDVKSLAELIGADWAKLKRLRGYYRLFMRGGRFARPIKRFAFGLLFVVTLWPIFYLFIRTAGVPALGESFLAGLLRFAMEMFFIPVAWIVYVIALIYFFFVVVTAVTRFRGVAQLSNVVNVLDALMTCKVNPSNGNRVSFRDVKMATGNDLKIVASNIKSRRMELFDHVSTPDVKVADAVAASIAIPLLFKPVTIGGSQFCDGGLVSNLPAWTFDSERVLEDDCLTITCELQDDGIIADTSGSPAANMYRGVDLYERIARTAVFGASQLNTRGLLNHIRIPLTPGFGLLDFERTSRHVDAVQDAFEVSRSRLLLHQYEVASLEKISAETARLAEATWGADVSVRIGLLRPVSLSNLEPVAYRFWATKGFEQYADDRVILPVGDSLAGIAIAENSARIWDLDDRTDQLEYERIITTTNTSKLLAKDRKWVAVLPVDQQAMDNFTTSRQELTVAITVDGASKLPLCKDTFLSSLRDAVAGSGMFTLHPDRNLNRG